MANELLDLRLSSKVGGVMFKVDSSKLSIVLVGSFLIHFLINLVLELNGGHGFKHVGRRLPSLFF